jgi:hypothetical protein
MGPRFSGLNQTNDDEFLKVIKRPILTRFLLHHYYSYMSLQETAKSSGERNRND